MEKLIILLYFAGLLVLTLRSRKSSGNQLEYVLAGRRLTLLPFVATMVSTAYGWILGVGELYYEYGISAWLFLSLPYTSFALILAFFFAKKARQQNHITISDLLRKNYGLTVSVWGTFFFILICSPAMYLLMAGKVIHFVFGISVIAGIGIATIFSTLYLYRGGFKSVVRTDLLQFVWMFAGFAVLVVALLTKVSWKELSTLPETHLSMEANYSPWYILSWFLLAAFTLIDPNFYHRIYAAGNPSIARRGLLISVVCWTVFDFMVATCGLIGLYLFPELVEKDLVYLKLGQMALNPLLMGIFFAGILATIMSTVDSFIFYSALTLAKDILIPTKLIRNLSLESLTKWCLGIVSILGMGIAAIYSEDSVVDLFFDLHPMVVSVLLLPVLFSYFPRFRLDKRWVFGQMGFSFFSWLGYQIFQQDLVVHWKEMANISPIYAGLGMAALVQIIGIIWGRNNSGVNIRKIVISGPESTGKTSLAEGLAAHFDTAWVPEYLREYFEKEKGELSAADTQTIVEGQIANEKAARLLANKYLFCDTHPLSSLIYHEHYFGERPDWLSDLVATRSYDLILIPDLEIPWEPDPQRDSPETRKLLFETFIAEISAGNQAFVIIHGIGGDRLKNAIEAIEDHFDST